MDNPTTKLAQINKAKADNALLDKKHQELVDGSAKVSDSVLSAVASLIKYLDGSVSKTEIMNQIDSIGTPDVFEVKNAIDALHSTVKNRKDVDLSQITALLSNILEESKILSNKEYPKPVEQKFVDYTEQFKGLKDLISSVTKAIKAQKLNVEAPIVKVDSPVVNVDAPDLTPLQTSLKDVETAIKKIVIPEYKTDTTAVEGLIKASNKILRGILDKPVGGGGGGGGRATPYQDSNAIPAFVELINGKIPVDNTISDPTVQTNPSLVLGYGDGKLTTLTKTIGAKSYQKTLSYTGDDLTGVSAWTEL